MGRTPRCTKMGLNRGPWSREEDDLLTKYIQAFGEGGWRTLPEKAGLQRCGKSCRLRWMNYLRPDVKRGYISPAEEDLILRLHRLLGNRWSLIAGRIPGRTDNEIKNYWNTHLSKQLIRQGIDPRTHKPMPELPHLQDSYSPEDSDHPSQRSSTQVTHDCSQSEVQTAQHSRSNSLEMLQEVAMASACNRDCITNNFHVLTDPKLRDNANDFLRNSATPSPHIANSVLNFREVDADWKSPYTSMNYDAKASVFDTSFIFPDQPPSMLPLMPLNVDLAVRRGNQHMMSCPSLDNLPKYMDPLQSAGSESHNSCASYWNMTASTSMTSVWSLDMSSPVTGCGTQHTSVLGELYDFTAHGQNPTPVLPKIEFVSDANISSANPTLATNFSSQQSNMRHPTPHEESFILGDTNYMFPTSSYLCPITPIPVNKAVDEDPADSDIVFSSILQSYVHAEASLIDYNTPFVQNKQLLRHLSPHEYPSHAYNNDL